MMPGVFPPPDWVLTAGVATLMVVAMTREWVAPAVAVLGAAVVLLLLGVIEPAQALAGFANPAPITVAALFVVARAVENTGGLEPVLARVLGGGARPDSGSVSRSMVRMLVPVAGASAFFNNTPIVAMLIAPVSGWAERNGRSVSQYLMPLSFAALLGGKITLIGTSTNLLVSGLLVDRGQAPLGMFEMTPVALPIALVGLAYLTFLAPGILPARKGIKERFEDELRDFTIEMEVEAGGIASGKTVSEAGLRHLNGVFLGWILRGDRLLSPVGPEEVLKAGDRLGFVGSVDRILDLRAIPGIRSTEHDHAGGPGSAGGRFFEAVVATISPLVGETLRSIEFRERYQATVLAIHRSGRRISGKLGEIPLEPGDTLLLLADSGFRGKWRDRRDFLLVSEFDGTPPRGASGTRGWWVLGVVAAMVVLAALGVVPILEGALAAALFLVVSGALSPNEARSAVDLDVILLIASSFAVGSAIQSSGLAQMVAGWLVGGAAPFGPLAVLAVVVLVTLLLTEVITNNAAAVLVFPVAMAAATQAGVDPRAFAIAIGLAASASFLTPIGYQTNTMVYGPGGYRFGDFVRVGAPLSLIVLVGVVGLVGWWWGIG